MNVADFRSQLENELTWRTDEIVFFQNQCERLENEDLKDQFRRALVLLLYSNFEGFVKFSLNLYVNAVNQENIRCKEANYAIAAATLNDVLHSLRDGQKKSPIFKNDDPDDVKLHRFARDREFVERSGEILDGKVKIPESVIDTESNLKPNVLRKNLYRLGLPHDQFSTHDSAINKLLSCRNKIAHGESKQGVSLNLYDDLKKSTFYIMTNINIGLTQAFSEKWFLVGKGANTTTRFI